MELLFLFRVQRHSESTLNRKVEEWVSRVFIIVSGLRISSSTKSSSPCVYFRGNTLFPEANCALCHFYHIVTSEVLLFKRSHPIRTFNNTSIPRITKPDETKQFQARVVRRNHNSPKSMIYTVRQMSKNQVLSVSQSFNRKVTREPQVFFGPCFARNGRNATTMMQLSSLTCERSVGTESSTSGLECRSVVEVTADPFQPWFQNLSVIRNYLFPEDAPRALGQTRKAVAPDGSNLLKRRQTRWSSELELFFPVSRPRLSIPNCGLSHTTLTMFLKALLVPCSPYQPVAVVRSVIVHKVQGCAIKNLRGKSPAPLTRELVPAHTWWLPNSLRFNRPPGISK